MKLNELWKDLVGKLAERLHNQILIFGVLIVVVVGLLGAYLAQGWSVFVYIVVIGVILVYLIERILSAQERRDTPCHPILAEREVRRIGAIGQFELPGSVAGRIGTRLHERSLGRNGDEIAPHLPRHGLSAHSRGGCHIYVDFKPGIGRVSGPGSRIPE